MAYQYRGTIRDVEEIPAPRPLKLDGFDSSACGEYRGYRRHQKWGVPACQPCLDAMAAYSREYYKKRGGRPRHRAKAERLKSGPKAIHGTGCGSPAGYQKHYRDDTPVCGACRRAMSEYRATLKTQKRVA